MQLTSGLVEVMGSRPEPLVWLGGVHLDSDQSKEILVGFGGKLDINSPVTGSGDLKLNVLGNLQVTEGGIHHESGLELTGAGTIAFEAASTYTGETVISGNNLTVRIQHEDALGDPTVPTRRTGGQLYFTVPGIKEDVRLEGGSLFVQANTMGGGLTYVGGRLRKQTPGPTLTIEGPLAVNVR